MTDIQQVLDWYKKYHRLTNYIGAAMLYLKDNFFLENDLKVEHIKQRILGHWGTVPGLNFIYGGLNYMISKTNKNINIVIGPGHGAPAVLANLFLEGTISKYYEDYNVDLEGLKHLIKDFSWPGGFPSHAYPGVPGTIHEGGELGYSLGVAFGTVFDKPDLITVAVVGDGEAETGPLAASWHSNKFLNPIRDGVVLPILHLNGYKISAPTIMGTMSDEELTKYFEGLGYHPYIVDQYNATDIYIDFLQALIKSFEEIDNIKTKWSQYVVTKPNYPMIILRSKKGWSCPEMCGDTKLLDNNYSHGIPILDPTKDDIKFRTLEEWLNSYNVLDLLDIENNAINSEVLRFVPKNENKLGNIFEKFYTEMTELTLPDLSTHAFRFDNKGDMPSGMMKELSEYLRDIFKINKEKNNFRLFSPDESESNKLENLFSETDRIYVWPLRSHDKFFSNDGRVMEILSEHVLQEWMQGYNLTGRHGILISYEAFLSIITSQIDQHIKYIKQSNTIPWRKPLPSMNYVATSTIWRQDHNGFTHQNPTLINTLLTKQTDLVSVYFPTDVNTLLVTINECFSGKNKINLVVSGKTDLPQWLSLDESIQHVKKGISIWDFASDLDPDIVLSAAGDYQTLETLAAITILKEKLPDLKIRFVNVNEVTKLGFGDERVPLLTDQDIAQDFTSDRPVIFNFHGYPEVIKQLTWGRKISNRITILGYIEEGTTTTPFDMQVLNKTSRFHVCIEALNALAKAGKFVDKSDELLAFFNSKLDDHKKYIVEYGDDMPEIKNWKWHR